jgi:antitoxin component YwqK of YwqJK toxin-antitoxin module
MKTLFSSLLLVILLSCNRDNIDDKSKRNPNWVWWVDAKTLKGEWIPVSDSTTVKNGRCTTFYFNGLKYSEGKLVNSKLVDTAYYYDLKGQPYGYRIIKPDTSFLYYFKDGHVKSYLQDGSLTQEGLIKNHTYTNQWIFYYKNGNKKFDRDYLNGTGWEVRYYENGQMRDSGYHYGDSIDYIFKSWYENGQIEKIASWKNSKKDGVLKEYSEEDDQIQSSLKEISNWKNDLEDGMALMYYKSGSISDSGYFKEGKEVGVSKRWYDNGQLELKTIYENGSPIYQVKYDEEGNFIRDTVISVKINSN